MYSLAFAALNLAVCVYVRACDFQTIEIMCVRLREIAMRLSVYECIGC